MLARVCCGSWLCETSWLTSSRVSRKELSGFGPVGAITITHIRRYDPHESGRLFCAYQYHPRATRMPRERPMRKLLATLGYWRQRGRLLSQKVYKTRAAAARKRAMPAAGSTIAAPP